jgi:phosphonate metabolism protein (transferase hexapeptide repeat family)
MSSPADLRFTDPQPRIHPTSELKSCRLGRHVAVGERVVLREVTVGDYSYFERHAEAIYTEIGKFCAIAANTRINALEHPLERITQHKVSYRPNEYFRYLGVDEGFRRRRQGKRVTIGHDVWVGHGAVVMPGIAIGNGAAVGANAVVTRDVAPFTIVAGNPAKLLRRRFPEQIAARIAALAWWDWPQERLFEAIPDMQTLSIEAFLERWEG